MKISYLKYYYFLIVIVYFQANLLAQESSKENLAIHHFMQGFQLWEWRFLLLLSAEPQRVGLQRRFGKLVRLNRCNACSECKQQDCGACASCADKLKFGGTGKRKQACLKRKCLHPTLTPLPT